MMTFEHLEQYIDDDLALQLSEGIYTGKSSGTGRVYRRAVAAAACILILFGIINHSTLTATARNLAMFLFGGTVTEEEHPGYFVLRQAVRFGSEGEYCVELAYRDGQDVYAVVTRNSADGMGAATLTAGDTVYEDAYRGSSIQTVTEAAPSEEGAAAGILREKSEMQCHFTGVEEASRFTLTVDGQSAEILLEEPEKSAVSGNMILKTNQMSWIIWPLAPDNSVVGVSNMEDYGKWDPAGIFPSGAAWTADLLNPMFIGEDGTAYQAEKVGSGSSVWKTVDKANGPVTSFTAEGVAWELRGGEQGLISYTFQVPARGGSLPVNDTLTAGKLELNLKEIKRDENDHITLVFRPMTNYGLLKSGRMEGENSQSYGSGSGDDFTLSLGYTYYIMEQDRRTVKETVRQFPYETGEEMTVRIMDLELETADPASLSLVP